MRLHRLAAREQGNGTGSDAGPGRDRPHTRGRLFFITGRHDPAKADTAANLLRAGYHDWAGLSLEPEGSHFASAVDFKAPVRATIEARGYTILATVGDQRSDLLGGHAMRGFLLPNPFYFIP